MCIGGVIFYTTTVFSGNRYHSTDGVSYNDSSEISNGNQLFFTDNLFYNNTLSTSVVQEITINFTNYRHLQGD